MLCNGRSPAQHFLLIGGHGHHLFNRVDHLLHLRRMLVADKHGGVGEQMWPTGEELLIQVSILLVGVEIAMQGVAVSSDAETLAVQGFGKTRVLLGFDESTAHL